VVKTIRSVSHAGVALALAAAMLALGACGEGAGSPLPPEQTVAPLLLSPEDLVTVDLNGHRLSGNTPISTEGWMHLAMYRARPSIGAVVHAHPVTVTALGIVEQAPSLAITGEGAAFVGPIATVEWFIPGTEALATAVGKVASWSDSIILRHHGAVTAGVSLEEAFARMQSFEQVAQIYVKGQQLGLVREIPEADVRTMRGE